MRGLGVYAVPLVEMPQTAAEFGRIDDADEDCDRLICGNISLAKLWKSVLFGGQRNRRRSEFACIVFELSANHWPILMFASWPENTYEALRAEAAAGTKTPWTILEENWQNKCSYLLGWNYNELGLIVDNPHGLGALLHRFRESGRILSALGDDHLEIVVPTAIPRENIRRVIPYYERSRESKHRGRDAANQVENLE